MDEYVMKQKIQDAYVEPRAPEELIQQVATQKPEAEQDPPRNFCSHQRRPHHGLSKLRVL